MYSFRVIENRAQDDPDQSTSNGAEAVKNFIRNVRNKYNAKTVS